MAMFIQCAVQSHHNSDNSVLRLSRFSLFRVKFGEVPLPTFSLWWPNTCESVWGLFHILRFALYYLRAVLPPHICRLGGLETRKRANPWEGTRCSNVRVSVYGRDGVGVIWCTGQFVTHTSTCRRIHSHFHVPHHVYIVIYQSLEQLNGSVLLF